MILLEAGQATSDDTCKSIRNTVVEYIIRANQIFYIDLYVDDMMTLSSIGFVTLAIF